MTTPSLHQVWERLGRLTSSVEALSKAIDDNTRHADAHRVAIHKRVDDVAHELGEIRANVAVIEEQTSSIKADVKDAKEVTDKVKQWEQRGRGALFAVGVACTLFGGAVVGLLGLWWETILRILRVP